MTSLAAKSGHSEKTVEPMWSTRSARWPQAVFRRAKIRRAWSGQFGSAGTRRAGARAIRRALRLWANGTIRSSHTPRARRVNSSGLPELSSQTSATARRCSSSACAAIRARASSSVMPRWSTSRRTRTSTSACTTTTSGNSGAIPDSTSNGMSSTTTASSATDAMISERRRPTSGCTIPLSFLRASSSRKALAANAGRSSDPSGRRMSPPNASTSAARPSVPGSTTSRAMTSPSTMTAPHFAKVAETADLPAPMPPVSPMRSIT